MKTFFGLVVTLLALTFLPGEAGACHRHRGGRRGGCSAGYSYTFTYTERSYGPCCTPVVPPTPEPLPRPPKPKKAGAKVEEEEGTDALDEVNATRATHGLPPFVRDEGLTVAANGAAIYRAAYGMDGHTGNDFAFLPAGSSASAAGCAAWPEHMGWGACCTYESYRYAGAAWRRGHDGRRFMHIFVR